MIRINIKCKVLSVDFGKKHKSIKFMNLNFKNDKIDKMIKILATLKLLR